MPGTYHVNTRGNRRAAIFTDPRDRARFLFLFSVVAERHRWRCPAYCLMTNHLHLVVETRSASLSAGMATLLGWYSRWFNHRHELEDHTFGRRFNSVGIEGDGHLLEVSRYLATNPVRAGLCEHPREWRWGSYRAVAGLARPPEFLAVDDVLRLFATSPDVGRRRFIEFVEDARIA